MTNLDLAGLEEVEVEAIINGRRLKRRVKARQHLADFLRQAPFDLLGKPVHGCDRQSVHPRDLAGRVPGESAFKIEPFSRCETGKCRLQGRERPFQQHFFLPVQQLAFGRCHHEVLGAGLEQLGQPCHLGAIVKVHGAEVIGGIPIFFSGVPI